MTSAETKIDRAPGRPSDIDRVIRHDERGNPVTLSEQIVRHMQIGSYLEPAILAAGGNTHTVYGWLRVAGQARIRSGGDDDQITNPHERRCVEFSKAIEAASSAWEIGALGDLERLARGGIPQEVITIKVKVTDEGEQEIERTTRTTYTLPDKQVLEWRLERRFQDRYGQRVELTGAAGGPVVLSTEDRAEALLETARAAQARRAEPATPRQHRARKKSVAPT